jgi:hypothetical protein
VFRQREGILKVSVAHQELIAWAYGFSAQPFQGVQCAEKQPFA